jgi:hypothetical protein
MSDQRLRELLRQLQSGDIEVAPALYAEKQRASGQRGQDNHRKLAMEIFATDCKCAFGNGCVNSGRALEFCNGEFIPSQQVSVQYMHSTRGEAHLSWAAGFDDVYFQLRISGPGNSLSALPESTDSTTKGYYWLWNPKNQTFDLKGSRRAHAWVPIDGTLEEMEAQAQDYWYSVKDAAEKWISQNLSQLQKMQEAHVHDKAAAQWENLKNLQTKMQKVKGLLAEAVLAEAGYSWI